MLYASGTPANLSSAIRSGDMSLVDVRSEEEWNAGHIENAIHHFLGRLQSTLDELPRDAKLVVQCLSGGRSSIAASVLQANGFKNVVNLIGGYAAWKADGLPSVTRRKEMSTTEFVSSSTKLFQ